MGFTIRDARVSDMPEVLRLVNELAVFEKEADAVEVTVNDLEKDGFGDAKRFHCFVAETEENLAVSSEKKFQGNAGTKAGRRANGEPVGRDGSKSGGESDREIVGMALVYPRYSTWKGPVIHLEDLIVTEKLRGSGLGTALLTEVVKYGSDLGVKRISWEVLDWNEPAIKFYEGKGAKVMRDWDVVQLNESGMKAFLKRIG